MSSLLTTASLPRIPLVPKSLLKAHGVDCIVDKRFRAAARLLQHLWLRDNGIPTGHHTRRDGEGDIIIPLESLLSPEAARAGRNFISSAVFAYVRRELIMREDGACYDEERLLGNALTSSALVFSLFAPLAMEIQQATVAFQLLLPDFVKQVHSIRFETSPCRERTDPRFLMDGTAFDVALEVTTPDGDAATVFIEVKYSETMDGPAARYRDRYDAASRQVNLFNAPDAAILRSLALEQLWREHMLAQLAVDEAVTPRAMFVVIGPRLNRRVQAAARVYANELIPDEDLDYDRVRFQAITLETVIDAIREAGAVDLAKTLWARYCDFERIFHLAMAEYADTPAAPDVPPKASESKARKGRREQESAHVG